ncbi:protein kinase domain-containing protein [Myxococcus sp. Y35]|uniref:protein kinase domain-containing protein n=1 Tax=Pseudomyxococcus flavus TaxID=3115648 RepID=UPI003CED98F3
MSGNTLPLAPEARSLGKYEVLCRLSTGGMAEIFLASQRGLAGFHKLVVLKQILPDIRGEEEFVRMFLDEAKVTAAFNHPHIAQVYDLDIADGELFLSMEFVPGATLVEVARACRQAHTPIPMGYSLMAVRDTAVALHYAHTFTDPLGRPSPVIHRDVAEKNIMVTYEGVTKLLDFGIAKSLARASRTAVGMVKGTSGYMSPEQIMGEPLDARSDLFSLGVVLHECLTGMRLFYAKQAEAMMNAVLRCEVTPPSRTNKHVPPELDAIVMRALSKRREDRYASTLEFARAIERAVGPLIWHPEQSSELMLRLFSDRREQTRQLLMSGQTDAGDTTGVVKLAKVMAMGGLEPSELPTGGVAVTPPKPHAPAKALTPPPPPSPRRATTSVPSAAPPAAPGRTAVLRAPSGKRLTSSPPPPPSEALAPPPPEPSAQNARTAPGLPAIPPEHTVRAQLPASLRETGAPPPAAVEVSSRQGARLPPAEVPAASLEQTQVRALRPPEPPPPPSEEPRADPRARAARAPESAASTEDAPRPRASRSPEPSSGVDEAPRAEGRIRPTRTQDGLRAATPEPSAAGEETLRGDGRSRSPRSQDGLRTVAPELSATGEETLRGDGRSRSPRTQDGLRTVAPEPSSPRAAEDAPRSRSPRTQGAAVPASQPVERDLQTAMIRMPVLPPERGGDTVSVTPPLRRPASPTRRRQGASLAEAATQPVRVHDMVEDEDDESTMLGRGHASGYAPPRRSRAWMAVAGMAGVLALGAAVVMLELDGGVVSSRLKPLLGQGAPVASPRKPQAPGAASAALAQATSAAPGGTPRENTHAASDTGETKAPPGLTAPLGTESSDLVPAGDVSPDTLTDQALLPSESGDPESASEGAVVAREPRTFKRVRGGAQRDKVAAAPPRKSRTPRDAASAAPASSEGAPTGEPGFLTLVTEPKTHVFLGAQDLGKTPLFKVKLPAGQHTLKLVDATDKAHQVPVDIKPGETTSVRGPLSLLSDP